MTQRSSLVSPRSPVFFTIRHITSVTLKLWERPGRLWSESRILSLSKSVLTGPIRIFNSTLWKTILSEIFTAHVGAKEEGNYALPRIYICARALNIHKSSCLLNASPWLFSFNKILLHTSLYARCWFVHWGYSTEQDTQSLCLHKAYILTMSTRQLRCGQNRTTGLTSHSSIHVPPIVFPILASTQLLRLTP